LSGRGVTLLHSAAWQAPLAAALELRPPRTLNYLKLGIGNRAADRRVHCVDPNDRNASDLRTEHRAAAAKLYKLNQHANQKVRRKAECQGDGNREQQVNRSDQYKSSLERRN
jgi:hypothetical protein